MALDFKKILHICSFIIVFLSGYFFSCYESKIELKSKDINLVNNDVSGIGFSTKGDLHKIYPDTPGYIIASLAGYGLSGDLTKEKWNAFIEKTKLEGIKTLEKESRLSIARMLTMVPGIELTPYLKELIKDNLNTEDEYGRTPLYFAATKGNPSIFKEYIKLGANIDYSRLNKNGDKEDLINFVLRDKSPGSLLKLKFLLESGLTLDNEEQYFRDILQNKYARRRYLSETIANIDINSNYGSQGGVSLMESAILSDIDSDSIDTLLNKKPDFTHNKNDSFSILQAAALNKNISMNQVEKIISMGADVNFVSAKTGLTPLHYAVMYKRVDLINIYMGNGADPYVKDASGKNCFDRLDFMLDKKKLNITKDEFDALKSSLNING